LAVKNGCIHSQGAVSEADCDTENHTKA